MNVQSFELILTHAALAAGVVVYILLPDRVSFESTAEWCSRVVAPGLDTLYIYVKNLLFFKKIQVLYVYLTKYSNFA